MKQPIHCEYDLERNNNLDLVADIHVEDTNTEVIELQLTQGGAPVSAQGAAVVARFVDADRRVMLSDDIPCTVDEDGKILIPFDNAAVPLRQGTMHIEVSITDTDGVLTLPFPLWVRVQGSVLDDAQIDADSQGTIPALLREVREELARVGEFVTSDEAFDMLDNTLSGDPSIIPALLIDNDNPDGETILYYIDSGEERHDLLNLSAFVNSAIQTAIGGVENGTY